MRAAATEATRPTRSIRSGSDRFHPGPAPDAGADPGTTPADLETLFREHADSVLKAAYRVTGTMSDAEDVLQTVFLRLAGREGGLGAGPLESAGAGPYLRRAAVNAALDVLRARKRRRAVDLDGETTPQISDGAPDPERRQAGREARESVRGALARLGHSSPKAVEIFALRFFEGLANKEIARLLSMSQTAVAVSLHRTRSRLREELASSPGGLS